MSRSVLDASALLAVIYQEPGSAIVEQAIDDDAAVSTVNLAEVASKLNEAGMADESIREALQSIDVVVYAFDRSTAYRTGWLRSQTRSWGLSLGDRACLALAQELGLPVLTADRTWASLQLGVTVHVIR